MRNKIQFGIGLFLVLVLGTLIRLQGVDQKPPWMDEAFSMVRAAGLTMNGVQRLFFDGRVHRVSELETALSPATVRPVGRLLHSLRTDCPQHGPFYFLILQFWEKGFGTSLYAVRGLSVLFGVLLIGAVAWLAYEVFLSFSAAIWAALFAAIAPFFIAFSQETRPYILWGLLTALTSATLLCALRKKSKSWWMLHGTLSLLVLYTDPLAAFTLVGNGLFVLFRKERSGASIRAWIVSSSFAVVGFYPWMRGGILAHHKSITETLRWLETTPSMGEYLSRCLAVLDSVLLVPRFNTVSVGTGVYFFGLAVLIGATGSLACGTWREGKLSRKAYPILAAAASFLPFFVWDLLKGGHRASLARYNTSGLVFLLVILAELGFPLFSGEQKIRWARGKGLLAILAVGAALFSTNDYLKSDYAWNKFDNRSFLTQAKALNAAEKPFVVVNCFETERDGAAGGISNFLALSKMLKPEVEVLFSTTDQEEPLEIARGLMKEKTALFLLEGAQGHELMTAISSREKEQ